MRRTRKYLIYQVLMRDRQLFQGTLNREMDVMTYLWRCCLLNIKVLRGHICVIRIDWPIQLSFTHDRVDWGKSFTQIRHDVNDDVKRILHNYSRSVGTKWMTLCRLRGNRWNCFSLYADAKEIKQHRQTLYTFVNVWFHQNVVMVANCQKRCYQKYSLNPSGE